MGTCYREELVGVFGCPIDENPTVVVALAAFEDLGIPYRYLTVLVYPEDLGTAMSALKALNMKGIHLTIPHKVEVLKYLDHVACDAQIMGAVNTVYVKDGELYGENTDGKGFVIGLRENGISLAGKRLVILGAGGAARAISVECALAGAVHLTIINRTEEKGRELAALITENTSCTAEFIKWVEKVRIPVCDILVNATNIGLYPDKSLPDIDYDTINQNMVVQDIITNPAYTPFLQKAGERRAHILDGQSMLIYQGALAVELWTGRKPDPEAMRKALIESFT